MEAKRGNDGTAYHSALHLALPPGSKVTSVRVDEVAWIPADALCQAGLVEEGTRILVEKLLKETIATSFAFTRDLLNTAAARRIEAVSSRK